ncbi:MAG: TIGR02594 family protein [Pikeienuella sp.]
MKKVYDLARADLGTWEWADGHNPKVVKYFADVGHEWVKDDETAWCAAFVGSKLKQAGLPHTGKLNARSYLDWGTPVALKDAKEGDIVVFSRGNPNGWQGHVAFFVEESGSTIRVLGGNQSNQVNVSAYPKSRLLGIRRAEQKATYTVLKNPTKVSPLRALVNAILQIIKALGITK